MMKQGGVLDRKVFPSGKMIFAEGDAGRYAYFVESGLVKIYRQGADGHEHELGRVGQGGIFGEMALVDDQPRMASARAAKESVLILITRDEFRRRLEKSDPLIRGLLNIFVKTIRALTAERAPS